MKKNSTRKVIVILGPNASGKSEFAVRLSKKFNGEIISADSRQVYKGLNIGSGKVEGGWKKFKIYDLRFKNIFMYKNIAHHCIDFVDPKRIFNAYDFKKYGEKAINEIFSRGKIPIICGGAGFYIDTLLGNVNLAEISPDLKLREKLKKKSCEDLFKILQKLNPSRAKNIDARNKPRLVRAIEITLSAEVKLSQMQKHGSLTSAEIFYIGINHPSKILKQRIEERLASRLKQGMIKEIRDLHFKKGVSWKRLYNLGLEYRYVSLFLRQKKKIQESSKILLKEKKVKIKDAYTDFILKLKTEIWHYAKRQITWFKRNKDIYWILPDTSGLKKSEKLIKKFLTK